MIRCRATTAADEIDQATAGEFADDLTHIFRCLVIFAELIGQAGIWMGADIGVGNA